MSETRLSDSIKRVGGWGELGGGGGWSEGGAEREREFPRQICNADGGFGSVSLCFFFFSFLFSLLYRLL